ncbi:unnamed protein product [Vitrella brassicaformis CCMP3155]|uniref:Uncharacterized protein n=1 Tax=Vitrella brassicaformis (strain CCMP3155) TaxID=1169540 RepID=A0A0G4H403_VITBC|nr:unnamed protein product [Vitrella brassicaformis CCMP3155]|eukprot:CEM38276.1 unnamed protein product [Vitrella brassicaformis CCMP3155]
MLAKRKPRPTSIPMEEDTAFRESIVNHWSQLLSVELMKHNAFQVASRAQRAAAARGPRRASAFPEDFVSRGPYRPHTSPAAGLLGVSCGCWVLACTYREHYSLLLGVVPWCVWLTGLPRVCYPTLLGDLTSVVSCLVWVGHQGIRCMDRCFVLFDSRADLCVYTTIRLR